MLYIYRRTASEGARSLAEAMTINARKIGNLAVAHYRTGVRTGDHIVNWGEAIRENLPTGVRVLNNSPILTKYLEAQRLASQGVATVEVSLQSPRIRPAIQDAFAFPQELRGLGAVNRLQARTLIQALTMYIQSPEPVPETWLGRVNNHQGGSDLLRTTQNPDFYSKKENLVQEFRLHMFQGKSIRAGQKGPRAGVATHPWIRSYDGGWAINYNDFHSRRPMRDLAARAVSALGLDFGAVDLGQRADGSLIVLEVNRAPGLEGGTVEAYANAIERWVRGEVVNNNDTDAA